MPALNLDALDDQLVFDSSPALTGGQVSNIRANLLDPSQASKLVNCDIALNGLVSSRRGVSRLGTGEAGGGSYVQGLAFYDTLAAQYLVAANAGQLWMWDGAGSLVRAFVMRGNRFDDAARSRIPFMPDTDRIVAISNICYVDKDAGVDTEANLVYGTRGLRGRPDRPFRNIKDAVLASQDGDEIHVRPSEVPYDDYGVMIASGSRTIRMLEGSQWVCTEEDSYAIGGSEAGTLIFYGDLKTAGSASFVIYGIRDPEAKVIVYGNVISEGSGTNAAAVYQNDGTIIIYGNVTSTQQGLLSFETDGNPLLELRGNLETDSYSINMAGAGTVKVFGSVTSGVATLGAIVANGRRIELHGSVVTATGGAQAIYRTNATTVALYGTCVLSGSGSYLSTGNPTLELNGLAISNKPKEAGSSITGSGLLIVSTTAQSGTTTLS